MRTSRRWLTVIATAGGLLIAGSPAIAAEAGPAATSQVLTGAGLEAVPAAAQAGYNICLTHATHWCLVSNGTGRQVTVDNTAGDWATLHTVRPGNDPVTGQPMLQIQNANGNCLRAGTGNVVKIENGPCASTDGADWWIILNGQLESMFYRDKMVIHGQPALAPNVFHDTPRSGDWAAWDFF